MHLYKRGNSNARTVSLLAHPVCNVRGQGSGRATLFPILSTFYSRHLYRQVAYCWERVY